MRSAVEGWRRDAFHADISRSKLRGTFDLYGGFPYVTRFDSLRQFRTVLIDQCHFKLVHS